MDAAARANDLDPSPRHTSRKGDSGTPYLATNTDRQEIDGFVRHPKGLGFNIWSCVDLDDGWSCIAED